MSCGNTVHEEEGIYLPSGPHSKTGFCCVLRLACTDKQQRSGVWNLYENIVLSALIRSARRRNRDRRFVFFRRKILPDLGQSGACWVTRNFVWQQPLAPRIHPAKKTNNVRGVRDPKHTVREDVRAFRGQYEII